MSAAFGPTSQTITSSKAPTDAFSKWLALFDEDNLEIGRLSARERRIALMAWDTSRTAFMVDASNDDPRVSQQRQQQEAFDARSVAE
jgi:hypothetical protein